MPELLLRVGSGERRRQFSGQPSLGELLRQCGVDFSMPCAGNHSCGKCKLRLSGQLSPLEAEEACFLTQQELGEGIRLACFVRALGDVQVWLSPREGFTLSAVTLPPLTLSGRGHGLAVDVGTTTVAMQLYRLEDGALLGEALAPNRQAPFGADVISRIEFSNQNGGGALSETLGSQLEEMAQACFAQGGIHQVDKAVVTGNTTMLHFWEGLPAGGIAVSPFTPASLFGTLSRRTLADCRPFLPPCVGAYIGADISCALLSAGLLEEREGVSLLADLGTNGELALCRNGRILCASTAMGPALEGAGLRCGMQAGPGAVTALCLDEAGQVRLQVAGDGAATGLCGSAALDAAAILLELGILDESGLLHEGKSGVEHWRGETAWRLPGTDLALTQRDIRQIQLAKAALCAGIHTLLHSEGLRPEDIDHFYIAGGFGHHLNLDSAARVGLFPPALLPKAKTLGNAALAGAAALLLDESFRSRATALGRLASELPLSGNAYFSERYMDEIMFTSNLEE